MDAGADGSTAVNAHVADVKYVMKDCEINAECDADCSSIAIAPILRAKVADNSGLNRGEL